MEKNGEEIQIQKLLMSVSHAYFVSTFHQVKALGIHPGQLPILKLLMHERGLSQKEIAKRLCLSPPSVTMSIQRMEKAGMVSRSQDEKDQRVSRIDLTEKGKKYTDEIEKIFEKNEKKLRQGFSEAEICLFDRFCRQLKENIGQLERRPEKDDKTS